MSEQQSIQSSSEEESEILPILLLLWSKKIIILSLAIAGLVIGALYSLTKTPIYRADALLQLETKKNGITLSEDIADLMSNESEAITEIEILKSRMVVGKTVQNLGLDIQSEPARLPVLGDIYARLNLGKPGWNWSDRFAWQNESVKIANLDVPANMLGTEFTLTAGVENTFEIALPDETILAGSVGQPLESSGGFNILIQQINAAPGVEFSVRKVGMLQAIESVRQAVRVAEKGRKSNLLSVTMQHKDKAVARTVLDDLIATYVAQNIGRSSEEAEKSLAFLDSQIPMVYEDLTNAELELNEYRLQHESINLDLESAAVLERLIELDTQISQLSLEESEMSRLYTREHPRYASLVGKRQKLLNEKENLANTVQSFPETQQEILRRTRSVEVNQQIYLQLLNKKQELNVLKASAVGSVRIIDNAMTAGTPISPNKKALVLTFAMLGLMLGAGLVLLRYFLLKNVDSPEDITKLGLPVYATVPLSSNQEKMRPVDFLLSRDSPAELTVESMRSLRTSLHFGLLENGKGIVSVTGPSPALGKTFVSANLAYLAAESGSKVLLIDADMRRGTVGQVFGEANNSAGLSELLAGTVALEDVIRPISLQAEATATAPVNAAVQVSSREPELEAVLEGIKLMDPPASGSSGDTGSGGALSVVSRGKAPPNPSELLMQDKLPKLLKELTSYYDLVVIDTPPVLAATDSMIVGRYSDMNLMVVRHNQTAIHEMEEVVRAFKVNKVELSGVVLNGYDQKQGKLGQYGYSYGYQYNYESE